MQGILVYDSRYGNTEKASQRIAAILQIPAVRVQDLGMPLEAIDLLIVGSPTQGGTSSQHIQEFLHNLPARSLKGVKVASFDTRMDESTQPLFLRILMRTIGYAAPKIMKSLLRLGGTQVISPAGFIVEGKEGPLRQGEVARVERWSELLNRSLRG